MTCAKLPGAARNVVGGVAKAQNWQAVMNNCEAGFTIYVNRSGTLWLASLNKIQSFFFNPCVRKLR